MVRHFFIDKSATIIRGSKANTGMNPILSINYGKTVSRAILHFNEKEILEWIDECGINDVSKMSFILHLTNCFSMDGISYEKELTTSPKSISERAASFSLDIFELTQDFDEGRGYEYDSDFWIEDQKSYSEAGVNWYNSRNSIKWKSTGGYSEDKIIVSGISFDFGNENISVELPIDYILRALKGKNYGLGIKFSDYLEEEALAKQYTVDFFSNHTNTFFHPFIEIQTNDPIMDNRDCFVNGVENRLYFYAISGGERIDLDKLPTCTIDGIEYPVTKSSKGVYYATVSATKNNSRCNGTNGIYVKYDVWSNIFVNGNKIDDVELEFTVNPSNAITFGSDSRTGKDNTSPVLYGINDNEEINRGEVREITVDFRKKYTTNVKISAPASEYRIYVKDARREITVFDYQPVEHAFTNNFFVINTNDLIPHEYFIDIKTKIGLETRYHKEVLRFKVVDNITERYY